MVPGNSLFQSLEGPLPRQTVPQNSLYNSQEGRVIYNNQDLRNSNHTTDTGGYGRVRKLLNTSVEQDEMPVRVSSRFDLKEFVNKYNLEGIWSQGDQQDHINSYNNLAIHDFHRLEGKMKNQGPENYNHAKGKMLSQE